MIHLLDWILFFVFLWIIDRLIPDGFKEERGAVVGIGIIIVYIVVYVLIFWNYNWTDLPAFIDKHFTL